MGDCVTAGVGRLAVGGVLTVLCTVGVARERVADRAPGGQSCPGFSRLTLLE